MNTKELEDILYGKSDKSNIGKAWTITKCLSIFGWCTGKFIVKNTPTVLGAAWEIKKEISESIANEYQQTKKEQQILKMENQIKMLTQKGAKDESWKFTRWCY